MIKNIIINSKKKRIRDSDNFKRDFVKGSAAYMDMTKKDFIDLTTRKCKKCNHLENDHFLPVNTFSSKTNSTYTCRLCRCKIK